MTDKITVVPPSAGAAATAAKPELRRDPVCGMELRPEAAHATRRVNGKELYFCSPACVKKFDATPQQYLG